MSETSEASSNRRVSGILRSKAQATWTTSTSAGDRKLGPAPSDRDGNFILFAAVEGPMIERGNPLNDVYGVFGAIKLNLQKGHSMAFEDEYPANSSTRLRLDTDRLADAQLNSCVLVSG
jgi:hypothetical protein